VRIFIFLLLLPFTSEAQNLVKFVNPFVGTGGHGHTFPGATAPFGFCQLSPDTRIDGSWDGCGGYHYSDSVIYGFSHTHLSGTGVSDYGDILLMPVTRKMRLDDYQYKSNFLHKSEKAVAGYYRVFLEQTRVGVELTTSRRCGFHQYTFAPKDEQYVVLDLAHRDELLESRMDMVDSHTIRGYRFSKAWATNQKIFFEIKFEQEIERILYEPTEMGSKTHAISLQESPRALIKLKKKGGANSVKGENRIVRVKVGLSGVDMKGAQKNLAEEIPHWNFNKTKKWVQDEWNRELSKIEVSDTESTSKIEKLSYKKLPAYNKNKDDKKVIFYTALYHCMIAPNIYSDNDGRYRGRDDNIHTTNGEFDYYTVFSLWDTYRALHPLLTIIDKKRTNDFIKTFIKQYEQGGRLPVWELSANETNCMIGYHAVSVIWDAYNKGIRDYDADKAFEAMKSIATEDSEALKSYMKYAYVRAEDDHESVSKTLEYAYDDWCIAQMAKALGKEEDYKYFEKRSHNWINVYDPTTGFMRARKNSTLIEPFSPYLVDNNYTEANSWQYSFYVPHDVNGLIKASTGVDSFERKLDALFAAKTETEGRTQSDITGLIGQYAHGNEPSHHIAYLYHLIGRKEKGNEIINQIMNEFYVNSPNGYIGNEDCGQMSAWYVMNTIGEYSFCPGKENYVNNISHFEQIRIVEDKIKPYNALKGLELLCGYCPSKKNTSNYHFASNPYIKKGKRVFKNEQIVEFDFFGNEIIYISVDEGSSWEFMLKNELQISDNTSLLFRGCKFDNGEHVPVSPNLEEVKNVIFTSPMQTATFTKLPNDKEVFLKSKYSKTYHAGGPMGLVDGIHGKTNWRAGDWQGYQGQDFEAVVKYTGQKNFETLSANFLQDQRAWIFYPTEVSFYESTDSINWNLIETISIKEKTKRDEDNITIHKVSTSKGMNRLGTLRNGTYKKHYYKVKAKNYGALPNWHPGRGNPAYIFIDEFTLGLE